MFYRVTGTYHTRYEDTRQLWPLRADRWKVIVAAALALAAPLYLSDLYLMSYMLPWLIWTIAALALTLLMGVAGQVHFGFAAVMAIGAYTSIHLTRAGFPFELALLGAGFMAAIIGAIFGTAALRVKGLYLVMATLAMQYLIGWITVNVPAVSGGPQATLLAPPVTFLFMPLQSGLGRYYVALFWVAAVTLVVLNIKRSSFGRALVAVRDKDYAAQVLGVDIFRYKLLAFWISSFLGGIAGAVLAFCYYQAVTPEQFSFDVSIQLVAMVLVGGLAGFFVVPMNALLQHRGHILMGAGHSIAVQNFNENLSILVMTGLYALLIMSGMSINTVIMLFGLFVAVTMVFVRIRHQQNQREFDNVALLDDRRH